MRCHHLIDDPTDLRRKRRGPPTLKADVDHHLLAGGCEITRFSVEQSQEIVNPLAVGVQQLAGETDGIVEMQFLQVVDS